MPAATLLPEPRITTPRLVLRPNADSDIDHLVREIDDLAVSRMLSRVPHPYTRADAEAFLAALQRRPDIDVALAITRADEVIGGIGLSGIRGDREFGYWLGRRHWGQGYATEAAFAFLAFVFDVLRLDLVRSGVFVDNPASLRVQEKLGLERIGTSRAGCLARGADVDRIDTILTRERFEEIRP